MCLPNAFLFSLPRFFAMPSASDDQPPGPDNQIFYVVKQDDSSKDAPSTDDPTSSRGCRIEGKGVVICKFHRREAALGATAGDPSLRLVRHEELDPEEQEKVKEAFQTELLSETVLIHDSGSERS